MNALPIWFERVEGLVLAFGAGLLFFLLGGQWVIFLVVLIAVDISIAGYLLGPRFGAVAYNLAHSLTIPLVLLAIGLASQSSYVLAGVSLAWLTHIGIDRALGLGLKYPDRFGHTTLGNIGKK